MKKAPDSINPVFGYRTTMSMKNRDTWEFAHQYCGKLWWILGIMIVVLKEYGNNRQHCITSDQNFIRLIKIIRII